MSKPPDYKKEIMDSFKEGTTVTGVTISGHMSLKYLFKVSPPSANLDINNVGEVGLGIVSGIFVKDYAVK